MEPCPANETINATLGTRTFPICVRPRAGTPVFNFMKQINAFIWPRAAVKIARPALVASDCFTDTLTGWQLVMVDLERHPATAGRLRAPATECLDSSEESCSDTDDELDTIALDSVP